MRPLEKGVIMRTILKVEMSVEASNAAIKDGRLGKVMASTFERLKPEAAYFTAVNGKRGGFIVFDLKDPSDIPSVCEPFFMEFDATCELTPAMTMEDVQKGLEKAFPS
jgi:uncharacterized protein DUF3303